MTDRQPGESILKLLDRERVFRVEEYADGDFGFTERCDDHYEVILTRAEVIALANELMDLVWEEK